MLFAASPRCDQLCICAIIPHMANVDWDVLGKRIREARKRAALNQADLARATGLERTALNRIESGTRKVTALELADIADAIGVRMASFFEEPLPALVSHRSATGLDTPDSKIDSLLAEIADDVELVVSLSAPGTLVPDDSEAAPPDPEHWKVALSRPEDMAREVRELMGEDTLGPIQVLTDRVAELGLLVFSADIGQDTADAGTILLPSGAVSLVNSFMKAGRRRLALAHELGHYLIADDYSVDWRVASGSGTSDIESSLDRFARCLLLPEAAVRQRWIPEDHDDWQRNAALRLASDYRVDMSTLAARLQELGLVDSTQASEVRTYRHGKADFIELNLYAPTEELEGTSVPRGFANSVLKLLRSNKVSRERALSLLRGTFDEADLPEPRRKHRDEIWKYVS